MSNVLHVGSSDFEAVVLKSEKPVVVDFWAPWCGPCKSLAPILDEVSVEREDIVIVKVDVDESPDIAQKYGIRGVPTLCLFDQGSVEATKVGALNKSTLISWINNSL